MTEKKSHRKIYITLGIVTVLMFGFCFAMVPLYSLFCKVTGTNTSQRNSELLAQISKKDVSKKEIVDLSRLVAVQFTATNNMGLPWDFYPNEKTITVHPGERRIVFFHAKNTTSRDMTVQAIPSMTPVEALTHFRKIECFCFNQQSLKAGESKEMRLIFQIDKKLPKDIHVLTLAYTLFDATPLLKAKKV